MIPILASYLHAKRTFDKLQCIMQDGEYFCSEDASEIVILERFSFYLCL